MRSPLLTVVLAVLGSLAAAPGALASEALRVEVDQAHILKTSEPAETIIIGNPAIVDVAVHDTHTLILTGRSFGITNLIVIGRDGEPLLDETVTVGTMEEKTVRVFRQASRSTYTCTPSCQPTATIGDADAGFMEAGKQYEARQTMVTGSAD